MLRKDPALRRCDAHASQSTITYIFGSSERAGANNVAAARPPLGHPQACPTSCCPVRGPSRPPVHRGLSGGQRERTRDLSQKCRHGCYRAESDGSSITGNGPTVQSRYLHSRVIIVGDEDRQLVLLYADERHQRKSTWQTHSRRTGRSGR